MGGPPAPQEKFTAEQLTALYTIFWGSGSLYVDFSTRWPVRAQNCENGTIFGVGVHRVWLIKVRGVVRARGLRDMGTVLEGVSCWLHYAGPGFGVDL